MPNQALGWEKEMKYDRRGLHLASTLVHLPKHTSNSYTKTINAYLSSWWSYRKNKERYCKMPMHELLMDNDIAFLLTIIFLFSKKKTSKWAVVKCTWLPEKDIGSSYEIRQTNAAVFPQKKFFFSLTLLSRHMGGINVSAGWSLSL